MKKKDPNHKYDIGEYVVYKIGEEYFELGKITSITFQEKNNDIKYSIDILKYHKDDECFYDDEVDVMEYDIISSVKNECLLPLFDASKRCRQKYKEYEIECQNNYNIRAYIIDNVVKNS